jgi:hypothetical protein
MGANVCYWLSCFKEDVLQGDGLLCPNAMEPDRMGQPEESQQQQHNPHKKVEAFARRDDLSVATIIDPYRYAPLLSVSINTLRL